MSMVIIRPDAVGSATKNAASHSCSFLVLLLGIAHNIVTVVAAVTVSRFRQTSIEDLVEVMTPSWVPDIA